MDTYKEYLEIHYKTLQRENILMDESENNIIFMLKPFYYQLMHIMLKNFYADTVNQMCNF